MILSKDSDKKRFQSNKGKVMIIGWLVTIMLTRKKLSHIKNEQTKKNKIGLLSLNILCK